MTRLRIFLCRLWALVRSRQMDREIDDEIASHLAEATDEYVRQGLSPEDARRAAPTNTQVVRLPEQPAPVLKAADPAQRPNPLATLLRDPTLRKGDIVMFPDGPRVFTGDHGTHHAMADFVSASRSTTVAKSTRKILASLPVGENNAWSADTAGAGGRLAQGAPGIAADVEATGAVTGKSRSRR